MEPQESKQFDPRERVRARQASRDADERALARSEKSERQLRDENGLLAFPHDEVRIDYSSSIHARR